MGLWIKSPSLNKAVFLSSKTFIQVAICAFIFCALFDEINAISILLKG